MKKILKTLLLFSFLLIFIIFTRCFLLAEPGLEKIPGANFLKVAVGSRGVSLSEAYSSLVNDTLSLEWNPAGLGDLDQNQIIIDWRELSYAFRQGFIALGGFIKPVGGVGVSLKYFNFGPIEVSTSRPRYNAPLETIQPYALVATVGWGKKISPLFSLGISGKFFNQNLIFENLKSSSYAFDFGLLFKHSLFWTGAGIFNLGLPYKFIKEAASLPTTAKFSLAIPLFKKVFIPVVEIEHTFPGGGMEFHMGAEARLLRNGFLRLGCTVAQPSSFSFGAGWQASSWQIDASGVILPNLAFTYQTTFSYSFGGEKGLRERLVRKRRRRLEELYRNIFPRDKAIINLAKITTPGAPNLTKSAELFTALASYAIAPYRKTRPPWEVLSTKRGSFTACLALYISCLQAQQIDALLLSTLTEELLLINTGLTVKYKDAFSLSPQDYFIYQGKLWLPLKIAFFDHSFWDSYQKGREKLSVLLKKEPKIIYLPKIKNVREGKISSPRLWQISLPQKEVIDKGVGDFTKRFLSSREAKLKAKAKEYQARGDKKSLNAAGVLYAQALQFELSENCFKQAIALDQKYTSAYNNLGNLYALQHNYEMAELEYELALTTSPREPRIYFNWAFLYLLQEEEQKALEKFIEGLNKAPQEGFSALGIEKIPSEKVSLAQLKKLLKEIGVFPKERLDKGIKESVFLPGVKKQELLAQTFFWLDYEGW
jgi:tetratricopeptide (TPR) repeat protein